MMNSFLFMFVVFCFFAFSSCERNFYEITQGESKIVVEGWIEEGDVARVLLSHSIPMTRNVDSSNFMRYAIRSATVYVSDGVNTEMLALRTIRNPPRYLHGVWYVGNNIVGKTGGTYTLTVEYLSHTLTAETTIPPSVPITNVVYTRQNPTDTIGNLTVEFTNPADQQYFFQIATMLEGHDEVYVPSLYGNFDSESFASPDVSLQITRGITIFPQTNIHTHFNDGDVIRVRLRTMPKKGFDFWNIWQNEIINAQNAIFPANTSLKSNINGGIGIWCGYGQNTVRIRAE